jgi:hypothetical protein
MPSGQSVPYGITWHHEQPGKSLPSKTLLACPVPGCTSGPYKRTCNFKRHLLHHASLNCTAVDCHRFGTRAFGRRALLIHHLINVHDDDTLFSCLQCNAQFTKDIFVMHTKEMGIADLRLYRQCPFPICGFRVRWKPLVTGCLDSLNQHLLEKHTIQRRDLIADQLKRIGYNATTCNIICPICPPPCKFVTHEDFYQHFMQNHFHGPACGIHGDGPCSMGQLESQRFAMGKRTSVVYPSASGFRMKSACIDVKSYVSGPVSANIRCGTIFNVVVTKPD